MSLPGKSEKLNQNKKVSAVRTHLCRLTGTTHSFKALRTSLLPSPTKSCTALFTSSPFSALLRPNSLSTVIVKNSVQDFGDPRRGSELRRPSKRKELRRDENP